MSWSLILVLGTFVTGCALPTDEATDESSAELDGSGELGPESGVGPGYGVEDFGDPGFGPGGGIDDFGDPGLGVGDPRFGRPGYGAPGYWPPRYGDGFGRHRGCRVRCDFGRCRLVCGPGFPGRPGHPGRERCGFNTCGAGQYCCNASCGICAPVGGFCTQQACSGY